MARVAALSGSFRPGFSYQENVWAEALARAGHAVRVFVPAAPARVDGPFDVQRVPTRGLPRRHLFHTTALAPAVRAFGPELILWFGPPQRFGVDVARDRALAGVPLVAFMGQNRQMHTFDWRDRAAPLRERALAAAYHAIRGPAVALAARRAAVLVCNTPETGGIVLDLLPAGERSAAAAKIRPTPLGFDPAAFAFDPARRARQRSAAFAGRVVAAVSSRFAPEKVPALDLIFAATQRAMDRAPQLDALWVGFDEGPISRRFAHMMDRSRHRARLHRRPFGARAELAAAFHAADLAVFARPSISAQEALGAGLFAVLADGGSMDWLLTGPADGRFFAAGSVDALADALVESAAQVAAEPPEARAERASRARRLGYDRIIAGVLAELPGFAATG